MQPVLLKRGIGIRDLVTIRGDVTIDIITEEKYHFNKYFSKIN